MRRIEIRGRAIGPGKPVYVIAELSANHLGDFDRAVEMVRAAADAGADAVKLQTYTADTITVDSPEKWFEIEGESLWAGRRLYELYEEASTPWEWHRHLQVAAEEAGVDLFSSPFDPSAVDFLVELGMPAYKVASFELVDLPLIRHIARTGKPMIISTGMGTVSEIDKAVTAAEKAGCQQIALLRTNSAYPALPSEMDLRTIPHMAATWQVPIGISDHTLGPAVPIAAVTLGACIVEKHFTLDRGLGGPDAAFSAEPQEFFEMVEGIRLAEMAAGAVRYGPSPAEEKSLAHRRSLFIVRDLKAGAVLTQADVRSIRPADGLDPDLIDVVVGRTVARDVPAGTPLIWELLGA